MARTHRSFVGHRWDTQLSTEIDAALSMPSNWLLRLFNANHRSLVPCKAARKRTTNATCVMYARLDLNKNNLRENSKLVWRIDTTTCGRRLHTDISSIRPLVRVPMSGHSLLSFCGSFGSLLLAFFHCGRSLNTFCGSAEIMLRVGRGVTPRPFNGGAVMLFSIIEVLNGNALNQRVLRIAVGQQ